MRVAGADLPDLILLAAAGFRHPGQACHGGRRGPATAAPAATCPRLVCKNVRRRMANLLPAKFPPIG